MVREGNCTMKKVFTYRQQTIFAIVWTWTALDVIILVLNVPPQNVVMNAGNWQFCENYYIKWKTSLCS